VFIVSSIICAVKSQTDLIKCDSSLPLWCRINSLLFSRLYFDLRVTVSPDASLLCVSSVKCAPQWAASRWRSTLRWSASHAHAATYWRKHLECALFERMFPSSGERGASHHPADVPVLQKDDGILLPREKCWRGRGHWWRRQVPIGYYRYVVVNSGNMTAGGWVCSLSAGSPGCNLYQLLINNCFHFSVCVCVVSNCP